MIFQLSCIGVESKIGVLSSDNSSGAVSGCSSDSGSFLGDEYSAVGSQDKSTSEASLGGEGCGGGGGVVFLHNWSLLRMGGFVTGKVWNFLVLLTSGLLSVCSSALASFGGHPLLPGM